MLSIMRSPPLFKNTPRVTFPLLSLLCLGNLGRVWTRLWQNLLGMQQIFCLYKGIGAMCSVLDGVDDFHNRNGAYICFLLSSGMDSWENLECFSPVSNFLQAGAANKVSRDALQPLCASQSTHACCIYHQRTER